MDKRARIYMRVSTGGQDLTRQECLIDETRRAGVHVMGTYRETASGTTIDRPELQRMIHDLEPGEIVIVEKLDRLTRLPLAEAEALIDAIRAKGASVSAPGVIDLADAIRLAQGVNKIVLEAMQEMMLRIALQMAREDYELRRERQAQGIALAKAAGRYKGTSPDKRLHEQILRDRRHGYTIHETAERNNCSPATVTNVTRAWRDRDPWAWEKWKKSSSPR